MNAAFRSLLLVVLGFVLLCIQSAMATVLHTHLFIPHLLLPVVIFLGVSPDVHITRGALTSFLLGYLFDVFSSLPMSMHTFLMVAIFLVARGARLRLFLRGAGFQVFLTFIVSLFFGGAVELLRIVFQEVQLAPLSTMTTAVLASAGATALAAPFVFVLVSRLDMAASGRHEEHRA